MNDEDIDNLLDNALSGFFKNEGIEDNVVEQKERDVSRDKHIEVTKTVATGKEVENVVSFERKNTESSRKSKLQFDPLGGRKKQVKGGNVSRSVDYQRGMQDDRMAEFSGHQEVQEKDQLVALMQELLGKDGTCNDDASPIIDTLDALMKQQSSISRERGHQEPGTSGTDREDFGLPTQFLDGIMKQLVSKDVLYEPMKEICEKYPSWLEKERGILDSDDYRKYHDQYTIISKMCRLYETDPENFDMIIHLLQEMQQLGEPPSEIMKELAPDFHKLSAVPSPEECSIQ